MTVLRTCIVSKKIQDIKKMIRINSIKQGKVAVDFNLALQGRGAYLTLKLEYVILSQKKKLLDKKLKTKVPEENISNPFEIDCFTNLANIFIFYLCIFPSLKYFLFTSHFTFFILCPIYFLCCNLLFSCIKNY
ncbi:MAG: YlxR family protein [Candidatus Phytoplasma sp. TWB_XP]